MRHLLIMSAAPLSWAGLPTSTLRAEMSDLQLDSFYFDDSYMQQELAGVNLNGLIEGKHIRSRLLFLTGQLLTVDSPILSRLGRIVEMVHNATLTHDDVIDNAHTRRGHPSIPQLINNKKSVLLGDYMLAKALHELSDYQKPKLTQELTLTLKELVEGEWIQYEYTNPYTISNHIYNTLAIKKTGSLFRWSFIAPLHFTQYSPQLYQALQEFGEKLGLVFQMSDDIIDFNEQNQKNYGLDFKNNNINFVLLFFGRNHPELAKRWLQMEDISEMQAADKIELEKAIIEAKNIMRENLSRLKELCKEIKKELNLSDDSAPFQELCTLLDLISDRVF